MYKEPATANDVRAAMYSMGISSKRRLGTQMLPGVQYSIGQVANPQSKSCLQACRRNLAGSRK